MREDLVYLVQTDTTVGFLSCSAKKLAEIKQRPLENPFLKAIGNFKELNHIGRVPKKFRSKVRRSKNISYILPNKSSFRKVSSSHLEFISKFKWCYSTSANLHGSPFDLDYALSVCDVMVESKKGFSQERASSILRIGKQKEKKIR